MAVQPTGGSSTPTADFARYFSVALEYAFSAVGTKYVWGGNSLRTGVDCSGLIQQSYRAAGWELPRTAREQQKATLRIDQAEAQPGDLVFWDVTGNFDRVPGADHVGIYLGNGMVLEASTGNGKVVTRKLWGHPTFGRVKSQPGKPMQIAKGANTQAFGAYAGNPIATTGAPSMPEGGANPQVAAATMGAQLGLPPNATEAQVIDFIITHYGADIAGFLKIPDLRKVLIDAARGGEDPQLAISRMHATPWWKQRSESMRQWDVLKLTDPKQAQSLLAQKRAELAGEMESLGIDAEGSLAETVIRMGWNADQLRMHYAGALTGRSNTRGLAEGSIPDITADGLMRMAREEYLMNIDRQTAERWAIKGLRQGQGGNIEEQFRSYMNQIAAGRFGIDPNSGVAPADMLAPVKQVLAENLELDPNAIDLLDPTFSDVLSIQGPDGRYRIMNANEATKWARSQEGFKSTRRAQEESANLVEALGRTFGKVK